MRSRDITNAQAYRKRMQRAGFSLLEMAIVIIVIALLTGVSMMIGEEQVEQSKRVQTQRKLVRIEDALATFRRQYSRLPGPTDLKLDRADAGYGQQVTPNIIRRNQATNAYWSLGGVPFKALGLPEEFMFDGWGQHIVYVVDPRMTETEAFVSYELYENCGGITVNDVAGTRSAPAGNFGTGGAVYALISPGDNKYCGFNRAGLIINSTSSNAGEIQNCKFNADGTAKAIGAGATEQFSMLPPSGLDADAYDDIVTFKERWQLQLDSDNAAPAYYGPDIVAFDVDGGQAGYFSRRCNGELFTFSDATVSELSPLAMPTVSISDDNTYLAAYAPGLANHLTVRKRDVETGIFSATGVTVAGAALTGVVRATAFSTSGNYLAVSHSIPPYLNIYKRTDDTFTPLTGGSGPTSQPTGEIDMLRFSPQGNFLALVYDDAGVTDEVTVYKRTDDVFAALVAPFDVAPVGGTDKVIAFSPNSQYLAVASVSMTPKLLAYQVSLGTDQFLTANVVVSPAFNCAGTLGGLDFSYDSRLMAAGCSTAAADTGTSTRAYVYSVNYVAGISTFSRYDSLLTAGYANSDAMELSNHDNVLYTRDTGGGLLASHYIPLADSGYSPTTNASGDTAGFDFVAASRFRNK